VSAKAAPAQGAVAAAGLCAQGLVMDAGPGRRPRLDGASVELPVGLVAAVVGPNGAGKSSLLAALAGLARPRLGDVRLDGDSLFTVPRARLARTVAMVGPWTLPDIGLTVREVVSLGRLGHRTSVWQDPGRAGGGAVAAALEATELETLADAPLSTLSSGERQRTRLAAALAQGARFLLLDEPTASLDPGHARSALERIVALARAGHGVGVVLHDLTAAGQYADVVHLMAEGRLVASGPPADVLRPDVLEPVYKTPFQILTHPQSGRPVVVGAYAVVGDV
jgi:iron complex transport system ATP-binding protein